MRFPAGVEAVHAFGSTLSFVLEGADTAGTLAVALNVTPPGGGPPLHRHVAEDELFLVLDGQLEFLVAGEWCAVPPGGIVYYPRGVPHAFRNVGDVPSRHWVLVTPAGFEHFMADCAPLFIGPGPVDRERVGAIAKRHGIEVLGPPPRG